MNADENQNQPQRAQRTQRAETLPIPASLCELCVLCGQMTLTPDLVLRPYWSFLLSHPAHLVAFGFGAGLVPVAPGTWGTLLALPVFLLVSPRLEPVEVFPVAA